MFLLLLPFFCKSFRNRSSLKLSFKHLRADAELKFIQLETIEKRAELMKLESLWHQACLTKCNADYVFGNCNDKIVQLETNTKRAKLKKARISSKRHVMLFLKLLLLLPNFIMISCLYLSLTLLKIFYLNT